MPIRVKCQCGKALNVPDTAAGKAVKCPGCATVIRVPSATAQGGNGQGGNGQGGKAPAGGVKRSAPQPGGAKPAGKPAPRPAAPQIPAAQQPGMMDEMFDEEGFSAQVAQICPNCRSEMAAGSVLCTKCGFNKESGARLEGHKTAGVDISHGTLALQKAKADMAKAAALDKAVLDGSGMPWWMLSLVLFMIVSGLSIAVLAVNASRRIDESISFNPMQTFLMLCGVAFYLASQGAYLMIVVHAFKQEIVKGLLTLFVPFYVIYHVFKNGRETWKYLVGSIILGGISAAFLIASVGA
ncbi:hypothetical protein K227x_59700 [Rubripirellula lacrimiformis]|uniref:Double zinc ribbon n=1 Tax=Rubripirellula lacrimiformis TaxID=1930273 RepID=A0A517NK73_9BACT|nr:ABC transporter permease [Rubripirellula lacrimiformis]QDT07542.1 hypothetical protein K227x_59700 [Rubripirellula lacrimiformis]